MATTPKTQSSAGTTLEIATGAPATFDATGFAAQTYTKVGKLKNLGPFGKTFSLITSEYLDQRGKEKRKGTYDAGSLPVTLDLNGSAGQNAMEDANDSDDDFSFRVTFQDGTAYYVRGIVTEFMKNVGGPNQMIEGTCKLELQSFTDGTDEFASIKVPVV
ncbi:MAG: phage tail tube protein [Acidovorax sp.]|nr:phage tail tube protein [Acidovorax sp.]